ncbi:MAG: hypothetical protein ACK4VV_09795 [Pseudomonas sp.]
MPHELRLTTLLDPDVCQHPTNLVSLSTHLMLLDELCKSLGVSRISEFVDITAIEWQDALQMAAAEQGATALDPEPEQALTIEDMTWHPAALGMASLDALIQHLQRGDNLKLDKQLLPALVKEIDYCRQLLEPLETQGGQFNLAAARSRQAVAPH